jgi:hypothetical protein
MLHWPRENGLLPDLGKRGQEKTDEGLSETGEQPQQEKQSGNEGQDQRKSNTHSVIAKDEKSKSMSSRLNDSQEEPGITLPAA